MKKKTIFIIAMSLCASFGFAQKKIDLKSPNGNLVVEVEIGTKIRYKVNIEDNYLFSNNDIELQLSDQALGSRPKLISAKTEHVSKTLSPIVPLKFSQVEDSYNELTLIFKGNFSIQLRAYDEGIAYRFVTSMKDSIEVINENLNIELSTNYLSNIQATNSFKTAYEEPYTRITVSDWNKDEKTSTLPVLVETTDHKILISESDVSNYPCLFLKGTSAGLTSSFPKVPLVFGEDGDRSLKILKEANYIAKTDGKRNFPWRYFLITNSDNQLITNTMTYKLASKNQLEDVSWIKPGQVSWEWWNDASPYGEDVNFVSGYNLDTYKYYIDFASKFGIPYIIMDEGWALSTLDPYTPNPKVDLHELIKYGKQKNVDIILWLTWLTVENNMELFSTFSQWGIKGVKIDFMDRSDQWMMNFYERVAIEAAKHNLFVDFHGSITPKGLEFKYPNVLSYEGVRGQEQMYGCTPSNTIYLPFVRNSVGAMDFTPGAMINMQPDVYRSARPNSASMGTRAYNLAMFVIFESGLQMLCDNPTQYYNNILCTNFITAVPVTWDETKVLDAKVGEYIIVAKRKENKWFIGGMTNENPREFDIDLNFLSNNKTYKMTYFEDGINASRQAMDFRRKNKDISSNSKHHISMARNGGWAAIIE